LADRGAHVLVGGRNAVRGEAVVTSLRASGAKADFIAVDLGSSDSARELARRATELGDGHVDILVNNAAIFPMGPTASMDGDDIDAAFAINVKVPFVLVGELTPAMASRGKGAIVNVGTMAAEFGMPGTSLYGASKAALVLLTKAWAAEFGPSGVRVNAVNPGPTRTEGTAVLGEAIDEFAALAPAGRPTSPDEAASVPLLPADGTSHSPGLPSPMARPGRRRPLVRNGTDPRGLSARERARTCRPSAAELSVRRPYVPPAAGCPAGKPRPDGQPSPSA
jgi:NAD(P)-dependent dehydrogenase (short-subunit alcohol dehydrogenase family)